MRVMRFSWDKGMEEHNIYVLILNVQIEVLVEGMVTLSFCLPGCWAVSSTSKAQTRCLEIKLWIGPYERNV